MHVQKHEVEVEEHRDEEGSQGVVGPVLSTIRADTDGDLSHDFQIPSSLGWLQMAVHFDPVIGPIC